MVEVGQLVLNSFKYPLKNLAKLPLIFILFILIAIIPIGQLLDNRYLVIAGGIAFFLFLLIVPGYFVSIVRKSSKGSSVMPSLSLKSNIYDSIRMLVLRIVYMIVPAVMFLIVMTILGPASLSLIVDLKLVEFLATLGVMVLLIIVTYVIFEFLLFFAKARLAYLNSLSEALKINKVIGDIRKIGIVNIIKWAVIMFILMNILAFVTSFVMTIPYVGFIIYLCIVIPTMESIANYSLGMLYSNIAENEYDIDRFERELQLFKYQN